MKPIHAWLVGGSVLLGDSRLIVYGALLWLFFHLFVVAYEEPIPRWIPRMTSRRPDSTNASRAEE